MKAGMNESNPNLTSHPPTHLFQGMVNADVTRYNKIHITSSEFARRMIITNNIPTLKEKKKEKFSTVLAT
jgi:hypothetical protein